MYLNILGYINNILFYIYYVFKIYVFIVKLKYK